MEGNRLSARQHSASNPLGDGIAGALDAGVELLTGWVYRLNDAYLGIDLMADKTFNLPVMTQGDRK